MIVCEKYKVVFVAVPKTGTRSIYKILESQYNGRRLAEHQQVVPSCYKEFFTFVVKRNPYDRVCSTYWAMCRRNGDRYRYKADFKARKWENNLKNFLKLIQLGVRHRVNHNIPQYMFHNRNRIDRILDFDNLQDDFNTLPFLKSSVKLSFINATVIGKKQPSPKPGPDHPTRPLTKEMLNDEVIEIINQIYAKDFELLGYRMK